MARNFQIGDVSGIAESMLDDDIPRDLENVWDAWKNLADALKYTGPVAWRVKGGFSFQTDFPAMTQPHDKTLRLMQEWPLQNPEPTQPAIVFWIPRMLNGDWENPRPRQEVVEYVRSRYGLPSHHLVSLGSASLISALLLAGFKEGKLGDYRLVNLWYDGFPTDTITKTRFRIYIRRCFSGEQFKCLRWPLFSDEDWYGFFPIGIELGR